MTIQQPNSGTSRYLIALKNSFQWISRLGWLLLLWGGFQLPSVAQHLSWAYPLSSTFHDNVLDLEKDPAGNIYAVGYFGGTVDFEYGPGVTSPPMNGGIDLFVTKVDQNGQLQWVRTIGSTSGEVANAVTVDPSGNIWVVGEFSGTNVDFDPGPGIFNLSSQGSYDAFFLKLDPNGNFLWAGSIGRLELDRANAVAADAAGNVYITGNVGYSVDLNPGAGSDIPSSNGDDDLFLIKLNSTGSYLWGKRIGSVFDDSGNAVVVDVLGDVYVGGSFRGICDFDPGPATVNFSSAGAEDVFLAKFTPAGTFVWGKRMGSLNTDEIHDMRVDPNGDLVFVGEFNNTVDFNPNAGVFNISTQGSSDVFIEKLTVAGNFVWAKSIGGAMADYPRCLNLDLLGNIYVGGQFRDTVDLDPGIGTAVFASVGGYDAFVLALNGAGDYAFGESMGGTSDEEVRGIIGENLQTLYLGGNFGGVVDFDPSAGVTTFSAASILDGFLAKWDFCSPTSETITATACGSYTLNAQTYTTSGTFTQTLTNTAGCDSTLTLNLTINLPTSGTLTQSGCNSLTINGQTYTNSGTFTQALTNTAGCDSTLTLNLTINQATSGTLTQSGCNSLTINGQTYTTSGTFTQTLTNAAGCDSTLTLNLTINQATSGTLTQSGCNSLTINGQTYTTSGTFTQTLTNAAGCDSTLGLNLTINQATSGTLTQAGCNSLTINGQTYIASGTYTQTLTNTAGCDSTLTLNLTINQPTSGTLTQSGCNSLTINGQTYTTSGTFTQILTNAAGCDSTLTLNLTIGQATSGTLTQSGCNSLTINGQTYTNSGTFTQALTNTAGCDSTLTLNLTINQATSGTLTQSGCNSLTINGQTYTTSGTYTQLLTNTAGCDSTLTLNLTINQATSGTLAQSGCNSLTINGQTYTTSGTFTQTLTNTAGCDSTLTLNLTINQPTSGTLTQSGCNSLTINGQTYTTSGTFTQTLTNAAGCDSTLTLNLTINQATSGTLTQAGCNSLTINGQAYTTSGTYTQLLTNTAGCDSTLTLNLTINQATSGTLTQSGCNSLTINGQTYSTSGTYTQMLTNTAGCDSTLTLNLTINQATSGTLTQSGCNSLTINGQTYTNSGTFTQTLTNTAGCDSTLTLNLTINQATSGTLTQSGCNSLTINGQTYTNSGTFTQTLTNTAGCDSTLTLNLTINQATFGTLTQSGCNSLTINGQAYTTSGTYTQLLTNTAGCDSTLTLILTVNQLAASAVLQNDSLVASPAGALYQWLDCNASFALVPGATGQVFVPTQNGNYAVAVSIGTCVDTSACIAVILDRVDGSFGLPMISLFPNPHRGLTHLDLSELQGHVEVSVVNLTGQILESHQWEGGKVHLLETALPNGGYVVRVKVGDKAPQMIRMVIQE